MHALRRRDRHAGSLNTMKQGIDICEVNVDTHNCALGYGEFLQEKLRYSILHHRSVRRSCSTRTISGKGCAQGSHASGKSRGLG